MDWLRQEAVRGAGPVNPAARVAPEQDAAGAVDGVKDGKWGFHTGDDEKPWWQVDLQKKVALDHLLIYNRCDDVPAAARARRVQVLLSDDGRQWKQVYQHDGRVFFGQSDGKPLRVLLAGAQARFVRLQLPSRGYLHFDEVEVYPQAPQESRNIALGKPAAQSSTGEWSTWHAPVPAPAGETFTISPAAVARAIQRAAHWRKTCGGWGSMWMPKSAR